MPPAIIPLDQVIDDVSGPSMGGLPSIIPLDMVHDDVEAPTVDLLGSGTNVQRAGRMAIGGLTSMIPAVGDELIAGGAAGVDAIKSLFTGEGPSIGEAYDQRLNEVRGYKEAFHDLPGIGPTFVDVGSALAMPIKSGIAAKTTVPGKLFQAAKEGGAIGGLFGFGEGEGGLFNRAESAEKGAAIGAVATPALVGAGEAVSKVAGGISDTLSEWARKLNLSAYGANKTKIRMATDRMPEILDPQGNFQNPITKAIDGFKAEGGEKIGMQGDSLLKELGRQEEIHVNKLTGLLAGAEAKQTDVIIPEFKYTSEYISKLPGAEKADAQAILDDLMAKTVDNTDGTITSLQKEKTGIGNMIKDTAWGADPASQLKVKVLKRMYGDLRRTIEEHYQLLTGNSSKEVSALNQKIAQKENLYPLFKDILDSGEARDIVKAGVQAIKTTGGTGSLIIGSLAAGSGAGAIPASAFTIGGLYLNTPQGKRQLANALVSSIVQGPAQTAKIAGELAKQGAPRVVGALAAQAGSKAPEDSAGFLSAPSLPVQRGIESPTSTTARQQEGLSRSSPSPNYKPTSLSSKQDPAAVAFDRLINRPSGDSDMDAKAMIKAFEGLKLNPYNDISGVKTVGYGHTGSVDGPITKAKAEELLDRDIAEAEQVIDSTVKVPLAPHQRDALISLVFNIGSGAFTRSTLLKLINAERFDEAAEEFLKWKHDDGKVVQGLVNRREKEALLFKGVMV